MLVSAVCFTCMNSIIRYVDHLPTFELVFFRSIGSVICCVFVLMKLKISPVGNNPKILIARGVVGLISLALFYKALQMMPMASAVSLRYLSPFFAAAMAIIFLKEKMYSLQWLFYLSAFAGVLLLKGFDSRITINGLFIILLSAVFSGAVYVLIRKIGNTEHPIVVVSYFMIISASVGGIVSIFDWVQPQGIQWLLLSLIGIFGFVAQYFMTRALQIEEANLVTPFKYSEVIFTLLAGWAMFGEQQTLLAIMAMALIIVSLIANIVTNQKMKSRTPLGIESK